MIRRVRGMPRQFRFPWRTPSQVERDVDDELQFHLAMRAEELERGGLSPDAARREALRGFGDFARARRELTLSGQSGERQARWRTMLEDFWRDARYGARSLARSPGFTVVAVVVLAVGIGANSAAFNLVDMLLVRPVLVEDPENVVAIYGRSATASGRGASWGMSYPDYVDLRELNRSFADVAAFTFRDVGLEDGDVTRRVRADFVSANFFRTLGVPVARGRAFTTAEEGLRDAAVVIVSHDLWVRRGRDPGMLGSLLQINGESVAVIGIAAEGFTGHNPVSPELWLPLGAIERFGGNSFDGTSPRLDERENRLVLWTLLGRVKNGISRDDVDADLTVLGEYLNSQYPAADGTRQSFVATPLPRFGIGNAPDRDEEGVFVAFLATAITAPSAIVLLIACINLANMFLARGAGRRTEIAIRQALGGGRLRLVRQLLVEGLILAMTGGAAGVLVAYWAVRALLASIPTTVGIGALPSTLLDVQPGSFVLAATFVSCLVATALFALGPAWKISGDVAATLKESAGGHVATTGGRARTLLAPRNLLIMLQVALSLALLTAGGLFLRSAMEARSSTPGFALEPILLAELDPSLLGYDQARSQEILWQALERSRSLPGVESAALAARVHFSGMTASARVQQAGSGEDEAPAIAHHYVVTDGYFSTLGLPILRGRSFTAVEAASGGGNPVAIIDEPLADLLFGGGVDAVGGFIELPNGAPDAEPKSIEVVGVVPGTRHNMTDFSPSPHVYVPLGQVPLAERDATMFLQVRAAANLQPATLFEPLRDSLRAVDSALPLLSLKTMVEHRDGSLQMWAVRAGGRIFSLLGALALFLAVVGAYGVKAFLVTRRTREIGVRMALGATPGDVMRQMLRESMGLTVAGVLLGLVLAAAVARLLSALLYGVSPLDPLVLTVSAAVLAAALLLAAYLPTRRAIRIDPTTALRHE